jgi:hypothetical protein
MASTDTSQWRCRNHSRGTTAAEKLTRYRTSIETISTECSRSTCWHQWHPHHYSRSAYLFPDDRPIRMRFCEWLRHQGAAGSSSHTTCCEQTKRVLRVKVCSASTTVTSGHITILMLSVNVDNESASASVFGLVSWARVSYLRGWLLETVLPGLLEDVPLAMRQRLWLQHGGVRPTVGKLSGRGWTQGGWDMEGWLHGLLSRRI